MEKVEPIDLSDAEERYRNAPVEITIERTKNLLFGRYWIYVSKGGSCLKEPSTAFTLKGAIKKGRKLAYDVYINPSLNKNQLVHTETI